MRYDFFYKYTVSKHQASKALQLLLALVLITSCEDSDPLVLPNTSPEADATTVEVPITITLGDYENAGELSRSIDNTEEDNGYEETQNINTVRVISFRRQSANDNGSNDGTNQNQDDEEGFEYDPYNDLTLTTLTDEDGKTDDYLSGTTHKHRVARGTFYKMKGYEYRIVALAYDDQEAVPFPCYSPYYTIVGRTMKLNIGNGVSFKDFKVNFQPEVVDVSKGDQNPTSKQEANWRTYLYGGGLVTHNSAGLNKKLIGIPQLFYGECLQKDDAITGILYRGMAEVVLNIKTATEGAANPQWYCLLADNVLTETKLTSYDDFKHGTKAIGEGEKNGEGKYTAIAFHSTPTLGETITLRCFLLPGKTHLGLRVSFHLDPYARNGMFTAGDVTSAENATGVITVDAANNYFYLKRNHKYVFTCDDQKTLLKNHEIK